MHSSSPSLQSRSKTSLHILNWLIGVPDCICISRCFLSTEYISLSWHGQSQKDPSHGECFPMKTLCLGSAHCTDRSFITIASWQISADLTAAVETAVCQGVLGRASTWPFATALLQRAAGNGLPLQPLSFCSLEKMQLACCGWFMECIGHWSILIPLSMSDGSFCFGENMWKIHT